MNKLPLSEQITRLVEPLLDSLGLELWGLEYLPSTGRAILRVYIEKRGAYAAFANLTATETPPAGLTAGIDECTAASRLIGLTLEVEDLIPSAYVLEVSTPGLERRFFKAGQLAASLGQMVEVQLESPVASHPFRKKFSGILTSAVTAHASAAETGADDFSGSAEAGENQTFTLTLSESGPDDAPTVEFNWSNVKKSKLVYIEPVKEKPGKNPGAKSAKKSGTAAKGDSGKKNGNGAKRKKAGSSVPSANNASLEVE